MKSTYTISRVIAVIIIMIAVAVLALGIFGVFSTSEVKNSLQKVLELGAVIIVASVLVTALSRQK